MKWVLSEAIDKKTRKALKAYSDLEAQLLFNKKLTNAAQVEAFFAPGGAALLPAGSLPNINKAAGAILDAVIKGRKIFIYGDYDVDGVSSTSILFDFLYRTLKANVLPYIPNRFEEGYGLGRIGLQAIKEQGGELVISVDCGIRDRELVSAYSKEGLEFIITDHHTIPQDEKGKLIWPEEALAVVHPQLDPNYPFPQICATAVTWKLVTHTAELAVQRGILKELPETGNYLDLVALATVCDIMPLVGENRSLLVAGLNQVRRLDCNLGLLEILRHAQVNPQEFDAYHFGFVVGPRLNAAGRIEHALDGVRLLTSHSRKQVAELASHLNELNLHRQKLTQDILSQSLDSAEEQVNRGEQLIFVYGDGWSEGIVGLVASRLNEKFHKPVLAASLNSSENIVKGSARSIQGFDITAAISQSKDLLQRFGGHNQAAGFTLETSNLDKFIADLQALAKANISDDLAEIKLVLDAELKHEQVTMELARFISRMQPFGYGNREPVLAINKLKLWGEPKLLGRERNHLKFSVMTEDHRVLDVIGFNMAEKAATITPNEFYELAGTLGINAWKGNENLQLKLKDIKKSAS